MSYRGGWWRVEIFRSQIRIAVGWKHYLLMGRNGAHFSYFLFSFQIVIFFFKYQLTLLIGRVKGVVGKENTYTSSRDEAQEPTEFVCCLPVVTSCWDCQSWRIGGYCLVFLCYFSFFSLFFLLIFDDFYGYYWGGRSPMHFSFFSNHSIDDKPPPPPWLPLPSMSGCGSGVE